ncbi:hypothetical protein [Flavobacterium subsaxonicum]|uniref:Uncharacterized protein n=1 Tax=Flavobacterium subsaxonicum WB 4.1-42 = DSM 21790 TaxID=1121898 RepID=A0A0A2MR74_9FLAO|nr:hypothetical protein [Flavobacterium subsaxonicum]KGO94844.1 hypothetical protein Q766_01635 [Flavobacterium subsaxonicum WB 4.1-42 = DSM 21790]
MINERDLAEKFSAIWKENLPLLTPSYIRFFNEINTMKVNEAIYEGDNEIRYDMVSQLAFNCANLIHDKKLSFEEVFKEEKLSIYILKTAKEIWNNKFDESHLKLSKDEYFDTKKVCKNILDFIKTINGKESLFKPQFKGYGLIPDLEGDLYIDDTLIEIKTVKRNFRSSDLKQLFIYLALQQMTGDIKWKNAGLYNPRKGLYHKFNVRNIIYDISGGKSTTEVFKNILDSFTRDVNFDSRF